MAIRTFAGLVASLSGWSTRSDVDDDLAADFIALCESRIGRALRHNSMLTRSTASADAEFIAAPADFLAPYSMRLSGSPYTQLDFLTLDQMSGQKVEQRSGTMETYTLLGSEFWFDPAPSEATTVELIYYAAIPALSASNTTNWLLTAHPDVYLKGSLLELALYFEDDESAAKFSAGFEDAIGQITQANRRDLLAHRMTPRAGVLVTP